MNVRIAIATLGLLAAGSSFAQEATVFAAEKATSALSRAEVTAAVVQARAAGQLPVNEADFARVPQTAGTLTRAEVHAELLRAIASGEHERLNAEAYGALPMATKSATRVPMITAWQR